VSKKALIITDGTESIKETATLIADTLSGFETKICSAEIFEGTDLLPADVFFIGCEKPSPSSFSYLKDMLSHINLASRKCGIFSVCEETIEYLNGILNDSEAALGAPLILTSEKVPLPALENWVEGIIK